MSTGVGKIYGSDLAERLQQVRKAKGYTQSELADQAGLSRDKIANYERALSVPPADSLLALSRTLGVSIDWILTGGVQTEATKPVGNTDGLIDSPYVRLVTDPGWLLELKPTAEELVTLLDASQRGRVDDILDLVALLRSIRKG